VPREYPATYLSANDGLETPFTKSQQPSFDISTTREVNVDKKKIG